MSYHVLSSEQVQQFIENNYLVIEDCFSPETAADWVSKACEKAGVDLDNPDTWLEPHCFLGRHIGTDRSVPMNEFSPKLWGAVCDLLGGEDRIEPQPAVTDGFVVNFNLGADQPWTEPIEKGGWHVDGDFNQFIDSPESGLHYLMLWTDIELHGGATYIAPDSIPHILDQFLKNPQGLSAYQLRTSHNVIKECKQSLPAMGKAGAVYLSYPQMLHSTSQNLLSKPRFIRNAQIRLKKPMKFNRSEPEQLSPVERCALHHLGLDKLDFEPPSEHLRMATEHDTGELLPWKYGEKPSYKDGQSPKPKT